MMVMVFIACRFKFCTFVFLILIGGVVANECFNLDMLLLFLFV